MTIMKSALALSLLVLAACAGPRDSDRPEHARTWVCVSNEGSGDVTILDAATHAVVATIPVGKRPRGIHASPDGKLLYVALSGSPSEGPPQLDAQGNPILKHEDPEDRDASADGIGVVDLASLRLVGKLPAGSDPEQFAISRDGRHLYVSNEDVGTASIVDASTGTVDDIVRVHKEPEGVGISPDGSRVWVTCETGGELVVVDPVEARSVGEITIGGRPRSIVFLPDGSRAYVPSETGGVLHAVDTRALRETGQIKLPQGSRPMCAALDRAGDRLFVSNGRAGTVCIVDTRNDSVVCTIQAGKRPWGIALAPDEKTLYVANGPSNDISVIDVDRQQEVARIPAGKGPWGIAVVEAPRERIAIETDSGEQP